MTIENQIETDVLVVGGGLAGVFAAVKAKEQGADVTLVDKGYVSRTGQTPFAHCTAVYSSESEYTFEEWMAHYAKSGEYLNNREWTETVLKDSYDRYMDMVSWGIDFKKDNDGKHIKESIPGVPSGAPIWLGHGTIDFNWGNPLRRQLMKSEVNLVEGVMITQLLKQGDEICGAIGFSVKEGTIHIIKAKAVILCAGSGGFKPYGGWPISNLTADGHVMAYKVGAEITGKEFCDFHPRTVPGTLLTDGFPPRHLSLRNTEGEEVIDRGPSLPLDLDFHTHAGKAPLKKDGTVYVSDSASGMSVHTQEGIWPTGLDCSSGVKGLYAAGDNLATMMVGANYNGMGNATATCSSTGTRAGVAAAKYAKTFQAKDLDSTLVDQAKQKMLAPLKRKGGYGPAYVTQLIQNSMAPYFISRIKHGDRLQATLTLVEFYRNHLVPKLYANDTHGLRLVHETENMVINAEMRLRAALYRTESRGTHYREEFPRRDDSNWLSWVMLKEENGKMKLYKKDIPEEWSPDSKLPYEERYPIRFPGE
jgi:succinate dehydrogenase/fumarate reductase flavoprotein subunit